MYTYNDIEIKSLQLKAWGNSAPPVFLAFKQAAAGDFSSPEVDFILSNSAPLQEAGAMQRLRLLSQERAEIILGEIEASVSIADRSMDRVRILLRDRTAVYNDGHIQTCRQDVFDHMGYDAPVLDRYASCLSQEQRQGQVGFHLTRARGFMPAARGFDAQRQVDRFDRVLEKCLSIEFDQARASQTLLFETPMSAVDEAAFYAYAPPLPENVRAGFGQTSFDLGAFNMDAGSGVLSRLQNTVSYLSLIDRELIPQKTGFQHDWTAFKRTMIAEGQNSIDQVGSLFDRSRQYLTQSIYLIPS